MQINADQVDTLFRRRNSNAPTTQLVREPGRSSPSCSLNGRGIDLKQHPAEIERPYIAAALAQAAGVIADAARLLSMQRSEEHTSELQSLMRISYAVFCLKKNNTLTPLLKKY